MHVPTMPVDPADARHAALTREGFLEAELVREGDRAVDLRFLEANAAATALFGVAGETGLAGRRLRELAPSIDASWLEQWERAIRTGQPQREDQPSADHTRWFDCTVTPVGQDRAAVVFHDVSDRHAVEAQLREREARLALALEVAELGTWSWNLVTGEGDMDERGAQIVGLPSGDVDVQDAQRRSIHPEDLGEVEAAIGAGVAAGGTFRLAYRVIYPDGSVHHVLSRAKVITDAAGRPVRLIGTNRDVTPERDRERDQANQLERERRGREAAEAFLAVMSHELRTPITSIYGTATVIARDPHRADVAELVADVVDEAERLRRITDDLLVLSGVERGLIQLAPEPVMLQRALHEPLADVRRRFPMVEFDIQVPASLPAVVADTTALRQVLYNLLSNAAKYAGADGPITIEATPIGDVVEVAVRDHGPGPGDDPGALFALFYRAPHTAKRASGTGIGLYVTSQLLEAMGSSITAGPNGDSGAAFRFRVPLARDEG
jgi:signal transduction histidine kinase